MEPRLSLFSLVRPEAASPRATLIESASGQAVTDLLHQTPAELQHPRRSWAVPHRPPHRAALPRRRVRQCDKLSPWVSAMTFPFSSHRRAHLLGYARACQAVQNLYELCRRWLESQRPIHQQAVRIAGSEANNPRRTIPVMCRTDNCSNCRLLHYPKRNAAQKRETPALRGGVRQMVVAIPSAMQNDKAEPRPKSELHHSRSNLAWSSDRLPPAT